MEKVITEIIKQLPPWFYNVAAIIFLLLLVGVAWWVGIGAKRFSDSMGRENRIIQLQDDIAKYKQNEETEKNIAAQLKTAVGNASSYLLSLNNLRKNELDMRIIEQLMQRIVDGLESDIKYHPGEKHRCGIWMEDGDNLVLSIASSGFPENYINKRTLDINRSIGGKCYRKRELIHQNDVEKDDDWEQNRNSNSMYKALICIPLSTWGVLTIDALYPMNYETKLIGKLYARIIEGAMDTYISAIDSIDDFDEEIASSVEENDI